MHCPGRVSQDMPMAILNFAYLLRLLRGSEPIPRQVARRQPSANW
jgi:hypothetical protein